MNGPLQMPKILTQEQFEQQMKLLNLPEEFVNTINYVIGQNQQLAVRENNFMTALLLVMKENKVDKVELSQKIIDEKIDKMDTLTPIFVEENASMVYGYKRITEKEADEHLASLGVSQQKDSDSKPNLSVVE